MDANIHINIGENMVSPEQAAEALRAVMQMFGPQMGPNEGGGAPRGSSTLSFLDFRNVFSFFH